MNVEETTLPKKFHDAVLHWQRHNFPDYDLLPQYWEKYFPNEPEFCLCAKMELGMTDTIEVGDKKGERRMQAPSEMGEDAAAHLLAIIRAQASTEFGSIQQHEATLARAQDDEDRFWVLRVMAEELRHGYQMFHMLTSQDWSSVSSQKAEEMVEEILSMRTGSHVLDAFNLDYDSFVDNVVFAAVIDRVGKYQLSMQRVCAYKPFAQSMPPMLREEAFHLAAGVIPLRRWVQRAAQGNELVTMASIQRAFNKWLPRGLEMFGHEKGGDSNVRFGFKNMKNAEAQSQYYDECRKMIADLNQRYVRARSPQLSPEQAETLVARLQKGGGRDKGIASHDLLELPDPRFFRRKGEPAWTMIGTRGEAFDTVDAYLAHLKEHLPEPYLASRDLSVYVATLRDVAAGTVAPEQASKRMPSLKRVGGVCPCSKSVRWIVEEPAAAPAAGSPAAPREASGAA
ncbi:MAG TPA: Phenylacetic acid catabolic protein [Candidatus Eisenbacteria bacterium]|nr:Phenylacetic acid catabolic protein [Candidatus Eisenbacteria bacterium]